MVASCYVSVGVCLYLGIGRLLPIRMPGIRNIVRNMEGSDIYSSQKIVSFKKKSIEHVVPISYLKKEHRWDPINLVVTSPRLNNWRQDRYFTEKEESLLYQQRHEKLRMGNAEHIRYQEYFVPDEKLSKRGRIARIQLYMIHRYAYLDERYSNEQMEILMEWIRRYPITVEEACQLGQRLYVFSRLSFSTFWSGSCSY